MHNMDKHPQHILTSVFRGCRLTLHLLHGMLLAIPYPHLNQATQRRILKAWSRQLLTILNIGVQTEGQQPGHGEHGLLIVANHVSWLDIFVLNAIYPSRFIAKHEVRSWPLIGWLCQRSGTIFIERAMCRDAAILTQHVGLLLKQGACVGLFPEGTTTDGKQVRHFHSALIQPAIDSGAKIAPIALRYLDDHGKPSPAAAFTGDTTLLQSIWCILKCRHQNALAVFSPALITTNKNRRALARAAQESITQGLQNISSCQQEPTFVHPQTQLSQLPSYALLIDPILSKQQK